MFILVKEIVVFWWYHQLKRRQEYSEQKKNSDNMTKTQRTNTILEEDLQSIGLDDADGVGGRWNDHLNSPFDFTFLKKQRRKERIKLLSMCVVILVLVIMLVVSVVSYQDKKKENETLQTTIREMSQEEAKACLPNEEEKSFCICGPILTKDQNGFCRDINFKVDFPSDDQISSTQVTKMPQNMDNLTICVKIQIKSDVGNVFKFQSLDGDNRERTLSMSISNKSIVLLISGDKIRIQNEDLLNSDQSHVCIQYQKNINQFNIQLNGVNNLTTNMTLTRNVVKDAQLSNSKGVMLLGGDGFKGQIEHLFVYSRWLDEKEL
eukprot:TCONS_00053681-protein